MEKIFVVGMSGTCISEDHPRPRVKELASMCDHLSFQIKDVEDSRVWMGVL